MAVLGGGQGAMAPGSALYIDREAPKDDGECEIPHSKHQSRSNQSILPQALQPLKASPVRLVML